MILGPRGKEQAGERQGRVWEEGRERKESAASCTLAGRVCSQRLVLSHCARLQPLNWC